MNTNNVGTRVAFFYVGGETCRDNLCDKYTKVKGREGERVDTLNASTHEHRTLVNIKSDQVCLIDNCFTFREVAYVRGMTYFIVPNNEIEEYISPMTPELFDRKVLVLKEAKPFNRKAEEEKLSKTFYDNDGVLINKNFTGSISPEKLAHAGYEFDGDSVSDRVFCRFDPQHHKHALQYWGPNDNPITDHKQFASRRTCIDMAEESKLPVMYDEIDNTVSGKVYDILMPRQQGENVCKSCQIITHKDHKLNEVGLDSIELIELDLKVKKHLIELNERINKSDITSIEYNNIVKEIIYTTNFYKQFEILNKLNTKYKDLFEGCLKKESEQLDNMKNNTPEKKEEILEKEEKLVKINTLLQSCSILICKNEISDTVANIANLKCAINNKESDIEKISAKLGIVKESKKLYDGRIYINEELNELVRNGDFAAFAAAYSNGLDDNELLKTATDILEAYNNISRIIKVTLDRPLEIS